MRVARGGPFTEPSFLLLIFLRHPHENEKKVLQEIRYSHRRT